MWLCVPGAVAATGQGHAALNDARADLAALVREARVRERSEPEAPTTRAAWERVLALAPDDPEAHRALGHHAFNGVWYPTYSGASAARRAAAMDRLDARGETAALSAQAERAWVAWDEVQFLRMGWARDPNGAWRAPEIQTALLPTAHEWHRLQDTHFCVETRRLPFGGTDAQADDARAVDLAQRARAAIEGVPGNIERALGLVPRGSARLVVLGSLGEYNTFAAGDPALGRAPTERSGSSATHYAYFADAWLEWAGPQRVFRGTGVCVFELGDGRLGAFAPFAARHAAALAMLEMLDPSPRALADATFGAGGALALGDYWREKRLPRWIHMGAAMYCERFFVDPDAADPEWARRWALENVWRQRGRAPLDAQDLERALRCALDGAAPDESNLTLQLAGLVMAFVLDGDCAPVRAAHQDLVAAMRALDREPDAARRRALDGGVRAAARTLEGALLASSAALDRFAR
ncbi:MAG: hypothetical protein R3F49_20005 [Planctomycetota bacterium]